jgi:hypothetical protein
MYGTEQLRTRLQASSLTCAGLHVMAVISAPDLDALPGRDRMVVMGGGSQLCILFSAGYRSSDCSGSGQACADRICRLQLLACRSRFSQ